MSLEIIPFESKYAPAFKALNIAWIRKHFHVEPMDIRYLENCQKSIVDQGGYIFFAKYMENIVGCFAFIRLNSSVYELGKMAVDTEYQGLKIGQKLLSFGIDFAKKKNWGKIVLYSSTKLDTALHIYKKKGFKEVVMETNVAYERSNIKMEMELK